MATNQVATGTEVPLARTNLGDGVRAGARMRTAFRLGRRSGRSLLWGSRGGTLIRCALSAPGGVSPQGRSHKRDEATRGRAREPAPKGKPPHSPSPDEPVTCSA